MYPVHFRISNISCLSITSEKSLFLTFIKVYNIIHEAQINTMDINFDHTYTQCLGIHIYTFTKTSNECKLISLEIFFLEGGGLGVMRWTQICRQGVLTSLLFIWVVPPSTVWDLVTGQLAVDAVFTFWATEEITAHCKNRKKIVITCLNAVFFFSAMKAKTKDFH